MLLQVVFILLVAFITWKTLSKPKNYPPGYWGLPFIGYIPLDRSKSLTDHLIEIRKNNGNTPVVSWRMGTKLVVFLFDASLIREAFSGKDFLNRPMMRILAFNGFNTDTSVVEKTNNGATWFAIRRFTLHHLRDLGMGKSSLIPVIQKEAVELVNDLEANAGSPAAIPRSITIATLNIIWQMVAHKRYSPEDEEFKKFSKMMSSFVTEIDKVTLVDFMPWLPSVIPSSILDKVVKKKILQNFSTELRVMLERVVEEHKKSLDTENPRDFIDEYLIEMERQKDNENGFFTMENLLVTIGGLFRAGTETTTTTFKWIIFYIIKYPEVQKRLQEEIDRVLPKGTLATHEDRPRLPYTEAVVNEVLRHSSFIKFGIMHLATKDTRLGGYDIPKDAIVCPSIFWVNFDTKFWDSPEEFNPDRFLDADGKYHQPKEGYFPFGVGRRQCIGESLARMALFLFLATAVQRLEFSPPPNKVFDLTPLPISFVNAPQVDQEIFIKVRQ